MENDLKITSVDIWKLDVPMRNPLSISIGSVSEAHETIIRINTNSDIVGWGEACPFPFILGDTQDTNFASAPYVANQLLGENPIKIETLMKKIERNLVHESAVRCAYDSCLYDILGKVANLPIYKILGGEKRPLKSDLTIPMMGSIDTVIKRAQEVLELGTNQIKVKVGYGKEKDFELIKTIREIVGDKIPIRIDANQGWDFPTAKATLRALEPLNIEYCEQPLPVWDFKNMKLLRNFTSIPICADESCFNHYDAFKLIAMEACDYINIKLMKAGGLHSALKINAVAESAGIKAMIGCFTETRLGLASSIHLATAKPNIIYYDLDAPFDLLEDPVQGGWNYIPNKAATILVSDEPGFGMEISSDILDKAPHQHIE